MKVIIFAVLAMGTISCAKNQICIDESKINKEAMCIQVYEPVCGCDGKTYGNSCEAENSGIVNYTPGECP